MSAAELVAWRRRTKPRSTVEHSRLMEKYFADIKVFMQPRGGFLLPARIANNPNPLWSPAMPIVQTRAYSRKMLACLFVLLTMCPFAMPQDTPLESDSPKPVVFDTQQDRQNMLDQLGITKLRPGKNADQNSANPANIDEAKANPYPNLPDLMTMKDGTKVTTPEQWWKQRRPEIVEDFEREVLGRLPVDVPDVEWQLVKSVEKTLGETEVVEKRLVATVDNSACPDIRAYIFMSLIVPKQAEKPVPTLMQFGFTRFGMDGEEFDFGGRGRFGGGGGPSKEQLLVEAGWGCATLNAYSVQEDNGGETENRFGPPRPPGGGLTRGIIGLTNKGQPRKPDDWGALRAWAWGASRGLDYLETDADVDATRVGIDGVSRFGKAALVTMAFDQRFATVLVGSSGEGGASLYRRNFGESVENLASTGGYHWMAGNFLKYAAEESSFGSKNASDLPVDSHMLIALCAPRPTFISYGIPEKGDAHWLDQQGSFMAAVAAQPVFRLLGARDLKRSDDYMQEKMPPVNTDLLEGELAWRQHDGGHTDMPNIPHFINWMNRLWEEHAAASQTDAESASNERPTTPGGAAIPDAVKIKRPTEEEVALAESALQEFIETAATDAQAVLKAFPSLVEVRVPRPNSAVVPNLLPFFQQKHQQNVKVAKHGDAEVLFMGDSITDFWRNDSDPFAGKQVFDENFGQWKVANFGIAGDTTQGVLYRLQNGEGEGFSPKAIMLMIGTNITAQNTAPEIAEGIGAIVLDMQKRFTEAKILLLAVFPRGKADDPVRDKIAEINRIISRLHDGDRVHYLDIGDKFLDDNGNIPQDVMVDGLHPSQEGYEIWAQAVKQPLAELLQDR